MTVTATEPEAIALQKLLQMVSECAAFQTAVGEAGPSGALNFIFAPEKRIDNPEQNEACPPVFAVVTFPDGGASETELVAGGGKNWFTLRGSLELQLIRQIEDMDDLHGELIRAMNLFGAIRTHLLDYAAVDDYLAINALPLTNVMQSSETEVAGYKVQKPFHKAVFAVSWSQTG